MDLFLGDRSKAKAAIVGGDWEKRIKISLASAHLGMAAILKKHTEIKIKRLVFARAIELLNEAAV